MVTKVVPPDTRRREINLAKETRFGNHYYVDDTNGDNNSDGKSWATAFGTNTKAEETAGSGDVVHVSWGDYDEAMTFNVDNVEWHGAGPRGSVAIVPSAANAVAITIDGPAGRTEEVLLDNIGGEGNGTGGGLHVKGNIRRIRIEHGKFEGGAFGAKLESTAVGSVGDVQFRDCEFAWTTTGFAALTSGGGDPITQLMLESCWFHNCTADGFKSTVSHISNLWIHACRFDDLEDGTAPTGLYIDAQVASTTGTITGCYFPAAVNGAKVLVAATCIVVGCYFTGGINTAAPT